MNPVRSLDPAVVSGHWSHRWTYLLEPFAGGALAVGVAWIFRGPPTLATDDASQGAPSPQRRPVPALSSLPARAVRSSRGPTPARNRTALSLDVER